MSLYPEGIYIWMPLRILNLLNTILAICWAKIETIYRRERIINFSKSDLEQSFWKWKLIEKGVFVINVKYLQNLWKDDYELRAREVFPFTKWTHSREFVERISSCYMLRKEKRRARFVECMCWRHTNKQNRPPKKLELKNPVLSSNLVHLLSLPRSIYL